MLVLTPSFTPPTYEVKLIDGWHASVYADVPKGATFLPVAGTDLSTLVNLLGEARTYLRLYDDYREETVEAYIDSNNTLRCTPTFHSYAIGVHLETAYSPAAMCGLLINAIQHGVDGADGSQWLFGSVPPASTLGTTADAYINRANGDVYSKATGSWVLQYNMTGVDGSNGSQWLFGDGLPAADLGSNVDVYVNRTNGNVYAKTTGSWVLQYNLKGEAASPETTHVLQILLSRNNPTLVPRNTDLYHNGATVKLNTLRAGVDAATGTITLPAGTYLLTGSTSAIVDLTVVQSGDMVVSVGQPAVSVHANLNTGSGHNVADTFQSFGAVPVNSADYLYQDNITLHGVIASATPSVLRLGVSGDWTVSDSITGELAFYTNLTVMKVG